MVMYNVNELFFLYIHPGVSRYHLRLFFLREVILTHPRSWKGESKEKNVNKIVVGLQCQGRRTLNNLKRLWLFDTQMLYSESDVYLLT